MATSPAPRLPDAEQYLAWEREAAFKSEYRDGMITAMAGASERHNLLVSSLAREIGSALKGTSCRNYISDMRVAVEEGKFYTYPDITVVCGKPELADSFQDTLVNPVLIIEVLSASTEAYDRGEKFTRYRKLKTLKEVLFISQDRMHAELYRKTDIGWMLQEWEKPEDQIVFETIKTTISLADIYDRVEFTERKDAGE